MDERRAAAREPQPGEPVRDLLPQRPSLRAIRGTAAGCKACDLYARATQIVFGAGPRTAAMMLVGEQPGDAEDRAGQPFVGPAGRLLDTALAEAGIDRRGVFAARPGMPRRHSRSGAPGAGLQGVDGARRGGALRSGAGRDRDDSSVIDPSRPDADTRRDEMTRFVQDLRSAARHLS